TSHPSIYHLSLHDALPISPDELQVGGGLQTACCSRNLIEPAVRRVLQLLVIEDQRKRPAAGLLRSLRVHHVQDARRLGIIQISRSEEHTSELQSLRHLVCR